MISKVTVPPGKSGNWEIKKVKVEPNSVEALRAALKGRRYIPGEYTMLFRDSTLVMSDTPDEMEDHYPAVQNAKGHCLIVGLGIGMVLNAVASKPEVEHITVVEHSADVLNLVQEHYEKLYPGKITFINADIFQWEPGKTAYFDMAWYDIWDAITEANLPEMSKLHRKFGRKTGWQGSWAKHLCQRLRRQSKSY